MALYNIRQYYFQDKKFLKYEENYHVCKENENYGLLQAGVSQQTLKVADRSFKSFFNLIKKAKSGEYRFKDIKMPRYREKGGMFNLILSTNAINIKNGFLTVPMSRKVNFHSKCKMLGGVAEFFSEAFLCRFPPEDLPRPVVYPVHSLPV